MDGENVAALKARTAEYGPRVTIVPGDCNEVTQGAIESIAAPIRNTKNGLLYHLVHASKKGKGDAIWSSVTKIDSSGQTSLWSPDQRRRPSGASCAASTGAVVVSAF